MKEKFELEEQMNREDKNKKAFLMSLVAVAALSVAVFVAVGII
ncbi:MAG: hypothetical protein U5L75_01400 [Candidatus Campbellbacteria bacterium]|nr:hypothetical protein [Candidatus Campbellbacteria bacterium]